MATQGVRSSPAAGRLEVAVALEAALSHTGVGKVVDEYLILHLFIGLVLQPVPHDLPVVPRTELHSPWHC